MQNLSNKLAQAGVAGASPVPPSKQALLHEIMGLAVKNTGRPITDEDRLNRLPKEFESLRTVTWGEDFVSHFALLCKENQALITRDLIVVVCELAHKIRDDLVQAGKGGRQKTFARTAIPQLLALKSKMPKNPREVPGFVLKQLI